MQAKQVPTRPDTQHISVPQRASRAPRTAAVRHIRPDRARRVWSLVPAPNLERK